MVLYLVKQRDFTFTFTFKGMKTVPDVSINDSSLQNSRLRYSIVKLCS